MIFFRKIFGATNLTKTQNLYGTGEDWRKADKKQLAIYKENITNGIENGEVSILMLGRFLMGAGEPEEGERMLHQAVLDNVEGAESDYVDSVSYYYMMTDKYNRSAKQDPWYIKWVDAAKVCVENGENESEVRLADIYSTCYDINDPEFEDIAKETIRLYKIAASKHQSRAALNYAIFIMDKLATEAYKKIKNSQDVEWSSAEPYILQALTDEKNTSDRDYAYSTMARYYSTIIHKKVAQAIDCYIKEIELDGIAEDIKYNEKKVLSYMAPDIKDKDYIYTTLNNYNIYFDFLSLSYFLKKQGEMEEICDNYVYQIDKKRGSNFSKSMSRDQAMDILSKYYLANESELSNKDIKFTKASYNFMEKRKASIAAID
ncbi:hypothetical protein HCI99_03695 [Listeria booriae]|uniref:Uncharacterized protein n=1 Tax=Listeria booriae TaxID=1552123 RepID=A0A7X0XB28_9LIST|nr:hypothetical protein [Listeria booriae]MBC1490920.1 hypothetical protein [Listeria booriae]